MLTDEQKAVRVGKGMASEVTALLGEHPYASRLETWALNLGLMEFAGNVNTELGDMLEPGLKNYAATLLGWKTWEEPGTIFRKSLPWAGCTPDMLSPAGDPETPSGVQIKNSGLHMAKDYDGDPTPLDEPGFDNDAIPLYHLMQCQWEMFVSRRVNWFLGVYFGGKDFRLYKLDYDLDLVNLMVDNMTSFWVQHLDPNGPQSEPAPDGSPGAERYFRNKYPRNTDDLIEPTDEQIAARQQYDELGNKLDEITVSRETIKQNLMSAVGKRDGIAGICTWKMTKPKPKVDWESLAKAIGGHEEAIGDFTFTPDGNRTFRFSK